MKGIMEFYDKTCSEWASRFYKDESIFPCLENFINRFQQKPRILDLCCGAGYDSMRQFILGAEVVGLDFSQESINIARKQNPDIQFYIGDMLEDFTFVGSVDGIIVIAGFVHLPNEKQEQAFKNSSQVIKDSGLMLVMVRDGTGKNDKSSYAVVEGVEYDRDFYEHTIDELIEHSNKFFQFIEEVLPDKNDPWKRYLFMKL